MVGMVSAGTGDGEVDPMGIGSATLTDRESGLGYTDDPFIQPLECTLFGINCKPDETKIR